jgi:hypothetical protein
VASSAMEGDKRAMLGVAGGKPSVALVQAIRVG